MSRIERGQTPAGDQSEYEAVADFRSALRRFGRVSDEITRRHGLTTRRYELLVMIAGTKDGTRSCTATQLASRMHLAPHTVGELVARAERAGLVRREPDPADRRVSRITLTTEGAARLAEIVAALRPERQRIAEMLADVYQQAHELSHDRSGASRRRTSSGTGTLSPRT